MKDPYEVVGDAELGAAFRNLVHALPPRTRLIINGPRGDGHFSVGIVKGRYFYGSFKGPLTDTLLAAHEKIVGGTSDV